MCGENSDFKDEELYRDVWFGRNGDWLGVEFMLIRFVWVKKVCGFFFVVFERLVFFEKKLYVVIFWGIVDIGMKDDWLYVGNGVILRGIFCWNCCWVKLNRFWLEGLVGEGLDWGMSWDCVFKVRCLILGVMVWLMIDCSGWGFRDCVERDGVVFGICSGCVCVSNIFLLDLWLNSVDEMEFELWKFIVLCRVFWLEGWGGIEIGGDWDRIGSCCVIRCNWVFWVFCVIGILWVGGLGSNFGGGDVSWCKLMFLVREVFWEGFLLCFWILCDCFVCCILFFMCVVKFISLILIMVWCMSNLLFGFLLGLCLCIVVGYVYGLFFCL